MLDFSGVFSFLAYLQRADVRMLLWLNHYAAAHPAVYKLCWVLTEKVSSLLALATVLLFWFWPEKTSANNLFGTSLLGPATPSRWGLLSGFVKENPGERLITRDNSRAMALLMCGAGILAYVVASLLSFEINTRPPFASYWPIRTPDTMPGVFVGVDTVGAFPSAQGAMLAGFAAALFFWNRRLGWLWAIVAVVLAVSRVAVGLHYPSDMVGGALVGIACTWPLFRIYRRRGKLFEVANLLARNFDLQNAPYCYLLYFLLMLVALEAARGFSDLLNILFVVRYEILQTLRQQG